MKILSTLFSILAILLTNVMCGVVGFNYGKIVWGKEKEGFISPASVALLLRNPYVIGNIVCVVLAFVFRKKRTDISRGE